MEDKNTYSNQLVVSWERMHEDSKALAAKVKDQAKWKGIVAITKGGLFTALVVAEKLNIKKIETLCVSSYDHQVQRPAEVIKKPELTEEGLDWLIIDDLVDSGQTFKIARELFPKATLACVYGKPKGISTTDYYLTDISQETWIYFPWDEK